MPAETLPPQSPPPPVPSLPCPPPLAAHGHAADAPLIPGRTHFGILDDFAEPRSDLFAPVLSLCQPARPPNHPNGSPP